MAEEKQKKIKKESDEQYIFEVHTMAKDSEIITANPNMSADLQKKPKQEKKPKKKFVQKEEREEEIANPFLSENIVPAEQTQKTTPEPVGEIPEMPIIDDELEKIAFSAEEVVKDDMVEKKPTKKSGVGKPLVILLLVVFILGALGYVGYMYVNKLGLFAEQSEQSVEVVVPDPQESVDSIDETEPNDPVMPTYSVDAPNYFSLDVESLKSVEIVAEQLNVIEENMIIENIGGPISFVVRDLNQNPISFHVFAMSANMDIPQDVLASLEERFEIYAYRDLVAGVRFGFGVDVKNIDLLRGALEQNEATLPSAFGSVLGEGVVVDGAVFADSTYGTHAIRYANLDASESYSIDYTLTDLRLIVGTSKNTLRAILDSFKGVSFTP